MIGSIGGNCNATLQKKVVTINSIGEQIPKWTDYKNIVGFLDFSSGESKYDTYNSKMEETTHLFIMDYEKLDVTETNARLMIDGQPYEITKVDNPMGLNAHLEIFLKYTGE